MASISMTTAAVSPSLPSTGANASSGAIEGGLDQLFAQIMQQIQAVLEQPQKGAELPLSGDPLPPEQLSELVHFAEQLQGELTTTEQRQLTALVEQLAADGLPQTQIRQVAQTALLLQDAQSNSLPESQESAVSLLQLAEQVLTSSEGRDSVSEQADSRSIDEMLLLAEQLRRDKQGDSVRPDYLGERRDQRSVSDLKAGSVEGALNSSAQVDARQQQAVDEQYLKDEVVSLDRIVDVAETKQSESKAEPDRPLVSSAEAGKRSATEPLGLEARQNRRVANEQADISTQSATRPAVPGASLDLVGEEALVKAGQSESAAVQQSKTLDGEARQNWRDANEQVQDSTQPATRSVWPDSAAELTDTSVLAVAVEPDAVVVKHKDQTRLSIDTTPNLNEKTAPEEVVEDLPRVAAQAPFQTLSASTPEQASTASLAASARLDRSVESSRSAAEGGANSTSRAQALAAGAEAAAQSGESESGQNNHREGAREQGLARWVELRDAVFAQGQKLAQSESALKEMLGSAASSSRGEGVSLTQTNHSASLMQLQQAYQSTSAPPLAGFGQRFGSQEWTPAASQRISWMAGQKISSAQLRLDPPELGSLTIRLTIQGDQTHMSFTSAHAHVREILEQQMPRLREMLSEQGLELGQADVSDQAPSQGAKDDARSFSGVAANEEVEPDDELQGGLPSLRQSLALVDYYA